MRSPSRVRDTTTSRLWCLLLCASLCVSSLASATAQTIKLEFAQTHVIDGQNGKTWTSGVQDAPLNLHLVGNKKTLAIVSVESPAATPNAGTLTFGSGTILTLQQDGTFPETFQDATNKYSANAMWADIPEAEVVPGMSVTVAVTTVSSGSLPSSLTVTPTVGAPTAFKIISLPFYMFGANESILYDGVPVTASYAGSMGAAKEQLVFDRLPVASFSNVPHAAVKFEAPALVIGPSTSANALSRRATSKADVFDGGYATIGKALEILQLIRKIEGNEFVSVQYYSAVIYTEAGSNAFGAPTGSGLGGGSAGSGDILYAGAFWHEQGHAFGLGHAGTEYDASPRKYPYPGGSFSGAAWAFDYDMHKFIDVYAREHSAAGKCDYRVDAGGGLCFKQDVMQGGNLDTSSSIKIGVYSDVNVARMQRYFEGTTDYGGRIMKNATGHYSWDPNALKYVDVSTISGDYWWNTRPKGRVGRDSGLAQIRNVPVALAIADLNCVELNCRASDGLPANVLQTSPMSRTLIYKPLEYTGDMMRPLQVDDYAETRLMWPHNDAPLRDYCYAGCEYLLVFTMADGSSRYSVGRTWDRYRPAFRHTYNPWSEIDARAMDESQKRSQVIMAGSVTTGSSSLARVDVMYAPRAWRGIHNRVLQLITSWTTADGEVQPASSSLLETPALVTHMIDIDLPCASPSSCRFAIAHQFHVALEDSLFYALASRICLPEGSFVEVVRVCSSSSSCVLTDYNWPLPYFDNAPTSSQQRDFSSMKMTIQFDLKLTTSVAASQVLKLLRDDETAHATFVNHLLDPNSKYSSYFAQAAPTGVTVVGSNITMREPTSTVFAAADVPNEGCGQYNEHLPGPYVSNPDDEVDERDVDRDVTARDDDEVEAVKETAGIAVGAIVTVFLVLPVMVGAYGVVVPTSAIGRKVFVLMGEKSFTRLRQFLRLEVSPRRAGARKVTDLFRLQRREPPPQRRGVIDFLRPGRREPPKAPPRGKITGFLHNIL